MKQSTPDSTQLLDPLELKLPNAASTTRTVPSSGLSTIPSCSLPNVNLLTNPAATPVSSLVHAYEPTPTNLSLPNLFSYNINPYSNWASSILTALTQNPSATTSLLNLISATALNPQCPTEHSKIRTNSCFPLGRQSLAAVPNQQDDQPLDLTLNNRNRSVSPKLPPARRSSSECPEQNIPTGQPNQQVSQQPRQRNRRSVASRNRTSKRKPPTNQNESSDSVINEPDSTYQSTIEQNDHDLATKPPVSSQDKPIQTIDNNSKLEPVRQSTKRILTRLSDSFSNEDSSLSVSHRTQETNNHVTSPPSSTATTHTVESLALPTGTNTESRRRKTTASRRPFKVFNRPVLATDPDKLLVETAALIDQNLLTGLVDLNNDTNPGDKSKKLIDLPALVVQPSPELKSHRPHRGRRSQSASDALKSSQTQANQDKPDRNTTNEDSESSNLQDTMSTKSMDSLPIRLTLPFDVKLDASGIGLPTDPLATSADQLTEPSTDCNPRMRRFPEMTPKEIKDEAYWEKRFKNNEAARRSRRARKSKELCLRQYADQLEQVNTKLQGEIELLKAEVDRLKADQTQNRTN